MADYTSNFDDNWPEGEENSVTDEVITPEAAEALASLVNVEPDPVILVEWARRASGNDTTYAFDGTGEGESTESTGGNATGETVVSIDWLESHYTCDHFGMAEFFIDEYGKHVRWNEKLQAFMVYFPELGRWRQDGKKHEQVTRMVRYLAKLVNEAAEEQITAEDITGLASQNAREREAAQRHVDKFRRWYRVFSNTGNNYSVVNAVQPTARPCQASDFDQQPHLLNFPNGTYDVILGRLRKHDPADMLTHQMKMHLNLSLADQPLQTAAPHFYSLEKRMCAAPGEVPTTTAENRQRGIRSWSGYCVHGSNPEKLLGVLQGASQIGKTQYAEVICTLLGDDLAWQSARPQLLVKSKGERHDTEESALAGKRLVLVNELTREQFLDEGQVLRFVNPEGTLVSLRLMSKERMDARVTWKITVTTNSLPQADITPQVANRLLIFQLSCVETLPAERYDIKRVILENESEAVMAYLVKWWREWYTRWSSPGSETGLLIPEESPQSLDEYRKENLHPAELFIEERVVVEQNAYISSSELWEYCDAYYRTQHSDKNRKYLGGRRKLFEIVGQLDGVTRYTRPVGDHERLLGFQGVRLTTHEELRLLSARGSGREY